MSRKIKFVTAAVTALALAAPAASMASQPGNPGGFGKERSANIHTYFTNDGYGTGQPRRRQRRRRCLRPQERQLAQHDVHAERGQQPPGRVERRPVGP